MRREPTCLILHIGTEKTGTTAIQEFLHANRRLLARHKIYVPFFLGRRNHRWMAAIAYENSRDDNLIRSLGLQNCSLRSMVLALMRWRLRWAAHWRRGFTWIVSSENLHTELTYYPEGLRRLRQLTTEVFDDVRILVYLRRPLDTAVAMWSTALRDGGPVQKLPAPDRRRWQNTCHHRHTLESWEAFFPGCVTPRLFETEALVDHDLITDFVAATGIPADLPLQRPGRVNESLSAAAISLLAGMNRLMAKRSSARPFNPQVEGLCDLLERHGASLPRYRPTKEERQSYEAHYRASDAWTQATYFPDRSSLWSASINEDNTESPEERVAADRAATETLASGLITDLWQQRPQRWRQSLRRIRHLLESLSMILLG